MTSGLCNPEYYRGAFLEIRKSMEVREEGMEVQEEAATNGCIELVSAHLHSIQCFFLSTHPTQCNTIRGVSYCTP